MQEAITWICVDQDLRHHIAWLGHNEWSPKADFRIVLGSLTGLLDRIRCVTAIFLSRILGLLTQFLKLFLFTKSPRKCPTSYLIYYKLTCPGASFTDKAQILFTRGDWTTINFTHASHVKLCLAIDIGSTMVPLQSFNKRYETDGIDNNNFVYMFTWS